MSTVYRVGDLRMVIKESATKSEFRPVYGSGVQDDNKKINRQAYKDIEKETKSYDGGLDNKRKNDGTALTPTENKGMSDIMYASAPKPFKERVKSQLNGYVSADAEKKHKKDDFGNADFGSDEQLSSFRKHAKDIKKERDVLRGRGLTGSTKQKSEIENYDETMFESKKLKNIRFRHTEFLSEGHMLTKVPDEFKKDGNKFLMSDSEGNSYLVEWRSSEAPIVEKRINKKLVNEELNRIKNLYNYQSKDYFKTTTSMSRVQENREFSDMIGRARKLMK